MSRSSGFKINRHLHNFLRVLGVTFDTSDVTGFGEAQAIFELRSITGKYQTIDNIQNDLAEIEALEQQPQGASNGDSEESSS